MVKKKHIEHFHSKPENKEEGGVTYIKIDSPKPLRKEILETAIDSAQIIQNFEKYKRLKMSKAETFKKLVLVMKKIEKEVLLIKKNLPKRSEVKELEKSVIKEPESEVRETVEYKSEIDREIDEIKSKLNNLRV